MTLTDRLVYLESPYAGDIEVHVAYARRCMADSLARGEHPFASHLLYPQPGILDDGQAHQRQRGMEAGFAWAEKADATVVYADYGITQGMEAGIERAEQGGKPIVYRSIGRNSLDA